MALPTQKAIFFIFSLTFLISFPDTTATIEVSKAGFSLNLTFIDPENHRENITIVLDETIRHIDSRVNPTTIHPPMRGNPLGYFVNVGIRADNVMYFTLRLDTGGGLTWTQCHPCNPCFPQADSFYRPDQSGSFAPVLYTDPLCRHPYRAINNRCHFDIAYEGGSSVHGELGRETFQFTSSRGRLEPVKNIGFGCVYTSNNYNSHTASGIFSLGSSFSSFAQQLRPQTFGRFSYCLYPPGTRSKWSHLSFGADVRLRGRVKKTPLLNYQDSSMHFLDLIDLTIDTTRLRLPPDTFSRRANGIGGCAIDTSAPSSAFIRPAWDHIQRFFIAHFGRFDVHPVQGPATLCFPLAAGIERRFISMTLHFRNGADLYLRYDRIWKSIAREGMFCSTLTYHPQITVIGFMQQIDIRFMFDLTLSQLSFVPDNCAIRD